MNQAITEDYYELWSTHVADPEGHGTIEAYTISFEHAQVLARQLARELKNTTTSEISIWANGRLIEGGFLEKVESETTLENHIADAIGEHLARARDHADTAAREIGALDKRTFIVPRELVAKTVRDLELAAFELRCLLHDRY